MKKHGITVITLLCIGLSALAAQGALVHYTFNETAVGNWEVYVQVSGADTAGLAAYSIWVAGPDPASVSYTENTLSAVTNISPLTIVGFKNLVSSPPLVAGKFNAGNAQNLTESILGIGKDPVLVVPVIGDNVDLAVPALLGTLTTPAGLTTTADLYPGDAGLYNAAGDGYHTSPPDATWEVNPIPEPATLAVLALGGLAALIRRKS